MVDSSRIINQVVSFEYMCYKITNYRSMLERVFEGDKDKVRLEEQGVNIIRQGM